MHSFLIRACPKINKILIRSILKKKSAQKFFLIEILFVFFFKFYFCTDFDGFKQSVQKRSHAPELLFIGGNCILSSRIIGASELRLRLQAYFFNFIYQLRIFPNFSKILTHKNTESNRILILWQTGLNLQSESRIIS